MTSVDALRDGSFSLGDFRDTKTLHLRADASGNVRLNQYVVIKDLGQGAFGKVKLCLNTQTNRLCALKCINRRSLRRKFGAGLARGGAGGDTGLQREIAIMKKLVHPNVVRLYEVIDDAVGQYMFLALEYVPGGPVYDPARYGGEGMGEELARHYLREICRGLDFLHVNGVVHRDLKPDNLLKKTDGGVKICDFGVSELFEYDEAGGDDGRDRVSLDYVTTTAGTPAFQAPELIELNARGGERFGRSSSGKGARGKPSDVWSLGVCLYYMVCGSVPFKGDTTDEVYRNIVGTEPEMPGEMSGDLVDLLTRVLNKNPDERATLKDIMCHAWVTKRGTLAAVDSTQTATAEPTARELLTSIDTDDNAFNAQLIIEGESVGSVRTYDKGDLLMQQGDEGTEMFVIESGRVQVKTRKDGFARRQDVTRKSIDEDFDFDMSDDIVATAMMNKEEAEAGTGKQLDGEIGGKEKSRGVFACCFGGGEADGGTSAAFSVLANRRNSSLSVVIAERGAGDVIGEMSLLSETPTLRSATVKALTDVKVNVITKNDLTAYFSKSPEMLEELRLGAEQRRTELLVGTTQHRLGSYTGPVSAASMSTLREKMTGSRNSSSVFDSGVFDTRSSHRSSLDSADSRRMATDDSGESFYKRPETR